MAQLFDLISTGKGLGDPTYDAKVDWLNANFPHDDGSSFLGSIKRQAAEQQLADPNSALSQQAASLGITPEFFQSWVQQQQVRRDQESAQGKQEFLTLAGLGGGAALGASGALSGLAGSGTTAAPAASGGIAAATTAGTVAGENMLAAGLAGDVAVGALPAGATAPITGTALSAAPAAATGGSALSKIIAGEGGLEEWMKLGGQVLPSLISAYGSQKQANAQGDLADRYFGMGAPYRGRLEALYADPGAFLSSPEVQIPVQQGTDATARALSVQGNPAGSGRALQEIQNYSANQLFGKLGQEKDRLAGFGGLTAYNQAAPVAAQNAITAQGTVYGDLGYGVGQVLNPQQQSLQSILKQYNLSQGLQ